jgi:hypothetical protein
MTTKYLSLLTSPKENKKKTVFTQYLNYDFTWIKDNSGEDITQPHEYENVLCLGNYLSEDDTCIFKAWGNGSPNSYTLYRGILGEEDYQPL